MSVMQRSQLLGIARELSEILQIQLEDQIDPLHPGIILEALAILFPEQGGELKAVTHGQEFEDQWNCILEFIEQYLLDGQSLVFEALGIEEMYEVYQLVIDCTHEVLENHSYDELEMFDNRQPIAGKLQHKFHEEEQIREQRRQAAIDRQNQALRNQIEKRNEGNGSKPDKKQKQKAEKPKKEKVEQKKQSKSHSKSKNKPSHKKQSTEKPKQNKNSEKPSPKRPVKNIPNEPLQNELIQEITTAMKGKQRKPNNKILMKDPKSTEQVMKAKRKFDNYLNQFKREDKKQIKIENRLKKSGLDQHFLKALERRQKNIQQTVISEQLKYFLTLRDKKVAFINNIHSLTQKLERERLIQKQKQQRRLMIEERAKTHNKIIQSNALFEKNMELLKQNYKAMRQKNELQEYDERIVCKEMEECMKKKKMRQLEDLKMLWEQENMKLNNIMGDEEKIKNKLIDIYRRNRP